MHFHNDIVTLSPAHGYILTKADVDRAFLRHGPISNARLRDVMEIEARAFAERDTLERISLPEYLRAIGDEAFRDCKALRMIVLGPKEIGSLGKGVFAGCEKLKSFCFECELAALPERTFAGCHSLSEVTLPDSIERIGEEAFDGCDSLELVNVPASLARIEGRAFRNCGGLYGLPLPATVRYEPDSFAGCPADPAAGNGDNPTAKLQLKMVDLLLRPVEPDWEATSQGFNLDIAEMGGQNLVPEKKMKKIEKMLREHLELEKEAKELAKALQERDNRALASPRLAKRLQEMKETIAPTGPEPDVTVLSAVDEDLARPDGLAAYSLIFAHRPRVNVIVAEDVTGLWHHAFAREWKLETVSLPSGLQRIGEGAFSRCVKLKNLLFAEGVSEIGEEAFEYCFSLTEIRLPSTIRRIGDKAFHGCDSLQTIDLPASVESLGAELFSGCKELKRVTLPEGIERLPPAIFEGCEKLETIVLPDSIRTIGEGAFRNCRSLKTVKGPASLERIEDGAFAGCDALDDLPVAGGGR